jgi:hypothetical protein
MQNIETINDRLRSVSLPNKSDHEVARFEEHSEQDLATDTPDNGIHLNDSWVEIIDKLNEFVISTPDAARRINFVLKGFRFARFKSADTR